MSIKTIYDLKLHEWLELKDFVVLRVPGGWLYRVWSRETQEFLRETFVPLNTEFLYDDSKS